MENKDYPQLQPEAEQPSVIPEPAAEETGFVDFFADILPDQPVSEECTAGLPVDTSPAEPASGDQEPPVSGDTALLSEIQSAVESIIAQEEAANHPAEQEMTAPIPAEPEVADSVPAEPEIADSVPAEPEVADPVPTEPEVRSEEAAGDAPSEAVPAPEVPAEATASLLSQDLSAEDPEAIPEHPDGFEEMTNARAADAPVPTFERPVRKGRPKRKKGEFLFGLPQIAVTCVWLAIILVTGLTLGRMLWVCAADVLAFGREDKMVTVTVYESDTMEDIIEKLHEAELIRYPGLFKLYTDLAVDEGEIKPGIWDLNTMYDYHALVNMMSPSSSRTVVENVLIPEGYTCRQIFELLEENRVCTAKDLAEYAASGELKDYWFLENVERGYEYCLEGFLFPDTYDFYKNSNPRDVLEKLLDNFEFRFSEEMRAQIDTLNANVTDGSFGIHEVVIVASMIEKETAGNEESPRIASVIYNRLFNWGGTPAYLNIDASIVYALDGKTDLTTEDLKVESPYNTYTNTGLTPGAIANPGLASLKAALNPENTNYYFYVLNPAEGVHKFSTTLDEHNAFIATLE
ncbi:MAG: endolytic transglycosylase MltG [Oscillospiraceae bacterium]|nr:endolytic transglycosylase MltG [Oscillospiraceae bacterium]MBQ7130805.1 endolytic transglycosylase MltG [Oscillospiraceae bacterium]